MALLYPLRGALPKTACLHVTLSDAKGLDGRRISCRALGRPRFFVASLLRMTFWGKAPLRWKVLFPLASF